tara:strand:+ start:52 stop:690 length:639 start_codon:yes stop_codon:yes gene_type:complete
MDLQAPKYSAYASRKIFTSANSIGCIPKSDTFRYITVAENLKEKKSKANCFIIGNQLRPEEKDVPMNLYIPPINQNIRFLFFYHEMTNPNEFIGTFKICLPKATEGMKLKLVFDTPSDSLNVQKIQVKCKDTDVFRGLQVKEEEIEGGHHNNAKYLPFDKGGCMEIDITDTTVKDKILSSHVDLECLTADKWTATFWGMWTSNTGSASTSYS